MLNPLDMTIYVTLTQLLGSSALVQLQTSVVKGRIMMCAHEEQLSWPWLVLCTQYVVVVQWLWKKDESQFTRNGYLRNHRLSGSMTAPAKISNTQSC